MAQLDQFVDIEKAGAALDGVEAAENIVEQRFVTGALLQFHQLVVHIGQQLACFRQKIL